MRIFALFFKERITLFCKEERDQIALITLFKSSTRAISSRCGLKKSDLLSFVFCKSKATQYDLHFLVQVLVFPLLKSANRSFIKSKSLLC